jgi:DNA/RNA-binding domain of Phe-tRNA-synthetase-like protein
MQLNSITPLSAALERTPMPIIPHIAPEIFALRPDFCALSIHAANISNAPSDEHSASLLRAACQDIAIEPWVDAHLESWREAYRAFGAKPQRTPCSAEALRKRALRDNTLPSVNAVVDLYNAISLRYALPVGGEDATLYDGNPMLVCAAGGEPFDTVSEGQPKTEPVDPGEVIWRDKRGVTCRRWNWRQGTRTRITDNSTEMWFVLERLEPMPLTALEEAGKRLIDWLRHLSPNVSVSQILIQKPMS